MAGSRKLQLATFAVLALGIVLVWRVILQAQLLRDHPSIASWGAAFDILVSIPLLYYLLVIRRGGRAVALVPLFIACAAVAETLLPAGNPLLRFVGVAVIPLEIGFLLFVIARMRRAARDSGASDPVTRIRDTMTSVVPVPIVAEVLASELSVFYLALFSWRRRMPPADAGEFTSHLQSGWGTMLSGLLIAIAAESIAVHLWLYSSSPGLAWGLAALDVYGILWLIADYRALSLRRHSISSDGIRLRLGFRWEADLPAAAIESVGAARVDTRWDARLAIAGDPNFVITLSAPVVLRGLYGFRKRARTIGVLVDDPSRFEERARAAGLWRAGGREAVREPETKPAIQAGSRDAWLSRRPDYIPLEDWLKHPPPGL